MKLKEPLKIDCGKCKSVFYEKLSWLMETGRSCPNCQESFKENQERLNKFFNKMHWHFNRWALFMVIEEQFQIEVEDEPIEKLNTVGDAIEFLFVELNSKGKNFDKDFITSQVQKIIIEISFKEIPFNLETPLINFTFRFL